MPWPCLSPSSRSAASRSPFPSHAILALLAFVVVAPVALVSCGKSNRIAAPDTDGGVPAQYIAAPLGGIDFARIVLSIIAQNWDETDVLDQSWHYDAGEGHWAKYDSTEQVIHVGGAVSTQIRNETVVAITARFSRQGAPHAALMTADRVGLVVRIRQRRYVLDPAYPLAETYDLTTRFASDFALTAGSADTIAAAGSVSGWWRHLVQSAARRIDYHGDAQLHFDFPDHFVHCPGERMLAQIRVVRDGVDLDRFAGSFEADPGEPLFTGALESDRGPARFAINETRSCP